MPDNRWPNDNTRFRVEARDFDILLFNSEDTAESWKTVGSTYEYDTFQEAVAEAQRRATVYRELRVVRVVDTVIAYLKDGVTSE